jgi:ribosomal protein L22
MKPELHILNILTNSINNMAGCKEVVRQMAGLTLATRRCGVKLWSHNGNQLSQVAKGPESAFQGNACVGLITHQLRWSSFFTMSSKAPPQIEANPNPPEESETDTSEFSFAMDSNLPKLKPHIVQRRMKTLRTYEGGHQQFRHSPWRLNLVCQLAARCATLEESMAQVEFCGKQKSKGLVIKVLQRTANLADIRHCLQPSQLEVAECFATQGKHLKRIKFMGRGR